MAATCMPKLVIDLAYTWQRLLKTDILYLLLYPTVTEFDISFKKNNADIFSQF